MDDAMEGEPPAADPAVEVDEGVERMDVDAEMGVGVGMGADAELQSDLSDAGAEPMQADFEADQSMPTSSPALALDLPLEPAIHASAPNPAQLSFTASDPPAPVTPDQPAPPAQPEPPAQPAPPAPGTWAALATLPEETGDHYLRDRRLLAAAEATFTPHLLKYGREEFATPRGADLRKEFPLGTQVDAKVLEIDPRRGEAKLSIRAVKEDAEKAAYQQYRAGVAREAKFGTFADLMKKGT